MFEGLISSKDSSCMEQCAFSKLRLLVANMDNLSIKERCAIHRVFLEALKENLEAERSTLQYHVDRFVDDIEYLSGERLFRLCCLILNWLK